MGYFNNTPDWGAGGFGSAEVERAANISLERENAELRNMLQEVLNRETKILNRETKILNREKIGLIQRNSWREIAVMFAKKSRIPSDELNILYEKVKQKNLKKGLK